MDPIGERALWFVLGLLAGWLSAWLLRAAGRRKPATASRPELHAPVPILNPSPRHDDLHEHPHATPTARLIDVSSARAHGFNMKNADDLTIIEGIGPKIEELLHAHGIAGFMQLASASELDLLDLLDRGGPNFRLTNPARWAEQAALVVDNRWSELKELQRALNGIA